MESRNRWDPDSMKLFVDVVDGEDDHPLEQRDTQFSDMIHFSLSIVLLNRHPPLQLPEPLSTSLWFLSVFVVVVSTAAADNSIAVLLNAFILCNYQSQTWTVLHRAELLLWLRPQWSTQCIIIVSGWRWLFKGALTTVDGTEQNSKSRQ